MKQNLDSEDDRNRILLWSDLLFDSDSSGLSLPCCVFHQGGRSSLEYNEVAPKVLYYSSFKKCLLLHQEWLARTIRDATIRCVRSNRGTTSNPFSSSPPDSIDDIVVAYISGNSPDMLLSVLACSSSETISAIPALLNTRWTASEMISSLRSRMSSNKEASTRRTVTIILHDDSTPFRDAAQMVSTGLWNTNRQYTFCVPIPNFTNDCSHISTHVGLEKESQRFRGNTSHHLRERTRTCIQRASTEDALILFTSGTTGGSKGVRLSHRALLVQALAKLDEPCGYSEATAMLATTVPLFHVGGLSSFLAVLLARGHLIFPNREGRSSTKFQAQDIPKSLRDPYLPANTLVVVPAMLSSFFDSESKNGIRENQYLDVRLILIGGQSAPPEILQRCRYSFPNARIVQTYACTEAASSLTYLSVTNNPVQPSNSVNATTNPNGSCVGSPPNHVGIRIYNRESFPNTTIASIEHESPIIKPFELGLIATKGPHVMNGYWQRGKEVTHRFLDSKVAHKNDDRWFISSDLGFWDGQGRLYFAGRAKDVVRTGGETVLAREVEQVLLTHPSIAECAIFPRIDRRYGEAVACAVVARQSHEDALAMGTIKKWCREKGLAGYKQPKFLFVVTSLPKNSSGKVLKHKLVAKFGNSGLQSKL